jgi:hypothetical protein
MVFPRLRDPGCGNEIDAAYRSAAKTLLLSQIPVTLND